MGAWLCVTVGREANLISPGGFTRRREERTTLCVQLFSFRCFLKEEVKLCDVVSGLKICGAFDWSTKVCFLFFFLFYRSSQGVLSEGLKYSFVAHTNMAA